MSLSFETFHRHRVYLVGCVDLLLVAAAAGGEVLNPALASVMEFSWWFYPHSCMYYSQEFAPVAA